MKKEWFFDRFCGRQIVAYTEDGRLVEVGVEDEAEHVAVGNIYLGKVQNVVSGMQAAFVSCGLEKNCYLSLDEGVSRFSGYDGAGGKTDFALKEGDEILVQVVKLPRGSKGAKVSCDLSIVGKNLIYLPRTDFLGISRKITEPSMREELLKEADKLREEGQGFIVRTAAQTANKRQLKVESAYLKRIYRAALEAAKNAPAGTAVYRECDLPVKVMRDSLDGGVSRIVVGDRELYERIVQLARMRSDLGEKKIVFYDGARSMFSEFGISDQVYRLTEAQVPLGNGAYLVVDRTEAMTVIDVNTGKYTGESDLESTVFDTNLLAAREIARLVRLRDIGGIVAVDFIDMADEEHRKRVEEELSEAFSGDRSKCRVYPMNELCVTLFTRKRTNRDLLSFLLKPCPHCTRQGYVLSDIFMTMRLRSAVMEYFANGYRAVVLEMNRALMEKILSEHYLSSDVKGEWKDKIVYMVPHSTWHEEKFTIRGDNSGILTLPDDAQLLY